MVSEGDLDTKLDVTTRDDELGVLHSSLQKLVDTLRSMLIQTREVSKMKGEFLANMSHEIRTPINAIIGIVHLSLREQDMSEKQRDFLEKIQIAARSLLGIINDILDISKIEAGKLSIESTSFNLEKLIKDIFTIHQVNANSKSVDLSISLDPNIPQMLIGDPLRIGQILNNFMRNAIKFTADGVVSIESHLFHI